MTRSELVQLLASENSDLALRDVKAVVTTFFDEISKRLATGGRVELRSFGAFSPRPRKARTGRNPRTGAVVDVAAKNLPFFRPSKELHLRLNV
jgi:integration host factor subunit beta